MIDKKLKSFISITLGIVLFLAIIGVFPLVKASSFNNNSVLNPKLIGIDGTSIFHNQTINLAKEYHIQSGKELQILQAKVGPKSYNEGDEEEFWASDFWYARDKKDNDDNGHVDDVEEYMYNITATCKKVGTHAYIFVENGQIVSEADINHVINEFNRTIYPNVTNTFGSEPNVDGDQKIFILLLDIRDKRYHNLPSLVFVAGYFQSYQETKNPYSNHKDMIYIDVNPGDPGAFQYTIAHEFLHMIHWNHDIDEDVWVDEGLAVYAEYVSYNYHEMKYVNAFLSSPDTKLCPTSEEWKPSSSSLAQYGASYLWMLYLSEKYGDLSGIATHEHFIRSLVAEKDNGITGINNVLSHHGYGIRVPDIFKSWIIANYVDDNTQSNLYWYENIDISVSVVDRTYSGTTTDISDSVNQWAADYIRTNPKADTLYFENNKDFYMTSIRTAPDGTSVVRSFSTAELNKSQLNKSQTKEILSNPKYQKMLEEAGENTTIAMNIQKGVAASTIASNEVITPNNTVTNAEKYEEIVIIISPLDKSGGDYKLTLDEVQKIQNSIQPGQSAIYVIPVNMLFTPKPWNFYFWHGDVFTSVWSESPRNMDVNLTPVGFTSTVSTISSAIDLKDERLGKNKCYWLGKVWKLEIKERGTGTLTDPNFNITSNYYDNQLHQLPTVLKIKPIDMNAGSNATPAPIEFDVFILDGSNLFWYSPFDPPTSTNFEIKVGGKHVQSIVVSEVSQSWYHLTVTPPPKDSPGKYNLTVNFTFSKFGVSNTVTITENDLVEYTLGGNADIAIVIDSSGSMAQNDPNGTRKTAAKLFVDLASDKDQIAIIHFSDWVKTLKPLTLVKNNRSAIKAEIDKVGNFSTTNIGGGLKAGYDELNGTNANPAHRKATILLTDGFHNTGTHPNSVTPLYVAKGWPIYTIALTGDADEDLLKNIADSTGGKYYKAPTADDLQQIYNEISQVVKKQAVIEKKEGSIAQGESIQGSVIADSTVKSMDISLTWTGSDLNLTLFYPNGTQVQLNASSPTGTNDPNITYIPTPTYEVYSIINPIPGNWTYNIAAVQTIGPAKYTITAAATTPTMFSVSSDKTSYLDGEPVEIVAGFLNERGGIEGAEVTANITLPNLATDTLLIKDKGNGAYKAVYTNTTTPGTYKLEVEAVKGMIIRKQSLTFEVSISQIGIAITPTKMDLSSYPGTKVSFKANVTNLPGGSMQLMSEFKSLLEEIQMGELTKDIKMSLSTSQSNEVIIQPFALVSEKGDIIDATNILVSPSMLSIPDAQNGTANITINIPRYAPVGNYTGSIRFASPDGNLLMPLNLTVQKATMGVVLSYIKESYEEWSKAITPIKKDYYLQKMADDLVMAYYI